MIRTWENFLSQNLPLTSCTYLDDNNMWRGTGGPEPGRIGAGGGREVGGDGAGCGITNYFLSL